MKNITFEVNEYGEVVKVTDYGRGNITKELDREPIEVVRPIDPAQTLLDKTTWNTKDNEDALRFILKRMIK